MARTIDETVREVCLSFPETEEYLSHGAANFRVRGKTFAAYVVNHHGDGRVALWLNAPAGAQEHHVRSEPKQFFVPPYVGPRGWLGVHLDKGLSWKRVAALARQAYEKSAPLPLVKSMGPMSEIKPPRALSASELDPLNSRRGQRVLAALRRLCLSWPETIEDRQFGSPVWRVGKKAFAQIHCTRPTTLSPSASARIELYFWVGVAAQGLMINDERFRIPPYMGYKGWIALDATSGCDWSEVRTLALASYRHFALQRMLRRLEAGSDPASAAAPPQSPPASKSLPLKRGPQSSRA